MEKHGVVGTYEVVVDEIPIHRARRGRLTLRAAAGEIGISAATLSRIERGRSCDAQSFLRVLAWLGWSVTPQEPL